MFLRTLASGSSGNSVLVQSGETALLVDAGISCRKITQRLKACGLTPEALSGILITHEHLDHVSGLAVLLKHHDVTLYASPGTCQVLACKYPVTREHLMAVPANSYFSLDGLTVTSFPTPHDAAESVGYRIDDGEKSLSIATDLGQVPELLRRTITGSDLVLLETNHDVETLRNGPYPYYLQQRILGGLGHLCNEEAAALAVYLARHGTASLVLAHLSRENNTPELARSVVQEALRQQGLSPLVTVAPRDELSPVFEL